MVYFLAMRLFSDSGIRLIIDDFPALALSLGVSNGPHTIGVYTLKRHDPDDSKPHVRRFVIAQYDGSLFEETAEKVDQERDEAYVTHTTG